MSHTRPKYGFDAERCKLPNFYQPIYDTTDHCSSQIIAGKFGLKCRHLQDGVVEWQSWHGKWFHSFHLTSTEAYVIENAGEEPISWATISPEIPGVAFYYFPPLDVRVGTSFSLDEQTKIKMKDPERYHGMVNARFIHQVRRRVSYSGLV